MTAVERQYVCVMDHHSDAHVLAHHNSLQHNIVTNIKKQVMVTVTIGS